MRPIRLFVLLFSTLLLSAFLLYFSLSTTSADYSESMDSTGAGGGFSAYFSFRNPTSLFTPAATISLTDDNSTYFAARPAAFGPLLPLSGLSGEVWLGCGFFDDRLGRRGIVDSVEGELGCSDIPGWSGWGWYTSRKSSNDGLSYPGQDSRDDDDPFDGPLHQEYNPPEDPEQNEQGNSWFAEDGTDNHLHFPLQGTYIRTSEKPSQRRSTSQSSSHRKLPDGSAEISGKIVLLSRGGCGFAEKVKWAQRRGATAVIVGDNLRGGPLVRMYARGDTSNITIPSLFTSHTSAHLISSLLPVDNRSGARYHQGPQSDYAERRVSSPNEHDKTSQDADAWLVGTLRSFLRSKQIRGLSRRANSVKSRLDQDRDSRNSQEHSVKAGDRLRYPDKDKSEITKTMDYPSYPTTPPDLDQSSNNGVHSRLATGVGTTTVADSIVVTQDSKNIPGLQSSDKSYNADGKHSYKHFPGGVTGRLDELPYDRLWPGGEGRMDSSLDPIPSLHPGLWVTLTPTNMNTSPFFNTLFVLVVSPLVTLAIVYSMLLLRSRIRRRRWRAPKSVVERLPVRIYRALSTRSLSSNGSGTSQGPSQTTPLLADRRSNSMLSENQQTSAHLSIQSPQTSSNYGSLGRSPAEPEKSDSGLAEWKRRYGGKQVECVVCLEEYVDGVSKVMSLPCGHEFHVDCITPWLTTRRRTCPICKGDVVRSLGRDTLSPTSPMSEDLDEEEIQTQAAHSTNRSPSSYLPIPEVPNQLTLNTVQDGEGPSSIQSAPQPRSHSWLSRGPSRGNSILGRGALSPTDMESDEEDPSNRPH